MLNIAYNTTRLQRIIDDYQDKVEYRALRKKQNRGRAAQMQKFVKQLNDTLQGDSIAEIAAGLFRSAGFVRSLIERVGVPSHIRKEWSRCAP